MIECADLFPIVGLLMTMCVGVMGLHAVYYHKITATGLLLSGLPLYACFVVFMIAFIFGLFGFLEHFRYLLAAGGILMMVSFLVYVKLTDSFLKEVEEAKKGYKETNRLEKYKECGVCASWVPKKAKVCKYCQNAL